MSTKPDLEKFQHKIKAQFKLPARRGTFTPFPQELHPELQAFLRHVGLEELYLHQAKMFEEAWKGSNTVITTSTASGKTLSFLLPVVQKILSDPSTRAFFFYPTKALAQDQYRALQPILDYFGENRIQAGVYDGDTPPNERSRIRKQANIILSNPEMLNGSFIPNHSTAGFHGIFAQLRFIVLDELHVYRGAFGSHMSNILRRVRRICRYYRSQPQFLLSSATIANPVELAENLCHEKFVHIHEDSSPQTAKEIFLWQPPFVEDSPFRKKPEEEASELISHLVEARCRFITFCRSRRGVEVVLKEARDKLSNLPEQPSLGRDLSHKVAGYRGGYTRKERKAIEKKLAQGDLVGVIATKALELGIDVGDFELAIICGFPETKASFWQQIGRVGRRGKKGIGILILDVNSRDQYIALDPDYLLQSGLESAVIDKNNLFIQLAHVRAAAAELPLSLEDSVVFPDLGEIIPVLIQARELKNEYGSFHWVGPEYPAGDFNLRNISQNTYKIINQETGQMITEMDESQAFHEVYPKAIYIHDSMQYMVEELDLINRVAYVFPVDMDYFTVPFVETDVSIIKIFREETLPRSEVFFGDVRIRETIPAYKMVQFHNHQNLGYESIKLSLAQKLETEGIWYRIPESTAQVFDHHGAFNFYRGLQHALLCAVRIKTMGTREDVSTTFFHTVEEQSSQKKSYLLLYDLYPGGLGFCEKAFDFALEVLQGAIRLVGNCSCQEGCPACVGDYYLDKKIVLWGLVSLSKKLPPPEGITPPPSRPPIKKEKKEFNFAQLPDKWSDFVQHLWKSGEKLSEFFISIRKVEIQGTVLFLHVGSNFLGTWILDKSNEKKIKNIFQYYVEMPESYSLQVKTPEENTETIAKVMRRYDDLTTKETSSN